MMSHESRRSTRVSLRLQILVEGGAERLTCEGETAIVNLHGALITTTIRLRVGMKIAVHVVLAEMSAKARVVYVDPDSPRHCGIALDEPRNIWGVELPPDDWDVTVVLDAFH